MLYKNKNIFKSKNIVSIDVKDLISYLNDESHIFKWYGISFQKYSETERNIEVTAINYKEAFLKIVDYTAIDKWIIQPFQPTKLFSWFDISDSYSEISGLKGLFKNPLEFKGYISMDAQQIKKLFGDLFLYSYLTKSQDIMIFNTEKPFVIKVGQHLCLDVISTNEKILDDITELLHEYDFAIKKYN